MRRLIPFVIVAVGLAALAVVVLPNFPRFLGGDPQYAETRLGLDLRGGLQGEYQAITTNGSTPSSADMGTIRTIIENRVNASGVGEPVVQTVGSDRIVVELPGVTDQQAIRQLIGSTGLLVSCLFPAGPRRRPRAPRSIPPGRPSSPATRSIRAGSVPASTRPRASVQSTSS